MALTLEIDFMNRVLGTTFAPRADNTFARCLYVRCQIMSADIECELSDLELSSDIEMLRAIIPDEELERLARTGPGTNRQTARRVLRTIGSGPFF